MIALTIIGTIQWIEPGIARSRLTFRMPSPPPTTGRPRGLASGAGSRGNCPNLASLPPLTALVPKTEQTVTTRTGRARTTTNLWGLTLSQHPTFLFYVPYTKANTSVSAEFVLQDQLENTIYRQAIPLPDKAGTIVVQIPKTSAPLQVNQPYYWSLNIYCTPEARVAALTDQHTVWVRGMIQRNLPSAELSKQLAQAKPRTQLDIYATNGYWYDAIATLIELRQTNPADPALAGDWRDLLDSIRIAPAIATAPIVK